MNCHNCGQALAGPYCAACGQKHRDAKARGTWSLLREGFHHLTDLDGRLLRSLRALLLQPGELSLAWMQGRRIRYLSPIALFFLISAFFYFFAELGPPSAIAFEQDFNSVQTKKMVPADMREHLRELRANSKLDANAMEMQYATIGNKVKRAAFSLLAPILAVLVFFTVRKQTPWFSDALVFAMHLIAFVMLLFVAIRIMNSVLFKPLGLGDGFIAVVVIPAIFVLPLFYGVLAMRRSFALSVPRAWILALLLLLTFVIVGSVFNVGVKTAALWASMAS